jgi:hypothetical protein
MINYVTYFLTYSSSQSIPSDCNEITFINYGSSVCKIENVILQQNQSFLIGGHQCEYTDQTFNIVFDNSGSNNLVVVKKVYTNAN